MAEKEKRVKATHTFPRSLLDKLERIAEREQRPISRQLTILLERAIREDEARSQAA